MTGKRVVVGAMAVCAASVLVVEGCSLGADPTASPSHGPDSGNGSHDDAGSGGRTANGNGGTAGNAGAAGGVGAGGVAQEGGVFEGGAGGTAPACADVPALAQLSRLGSIHDALPLTFDPCVTAMDVTVTLPVNAVSLVPVARDPAASILVNGVALDATGTSSPVVLEWGQTNIEVQVTPKSGDPVKYVVTVTRTKTLTDTAQLAASSVPQTDAYGAVVAVSGDTMVVTAPFAGPALGVSGGGEAHVFVRRDGVWTKQASFHPANLDDNDLFGGSAAIDGDTIVIGAPNESSSAKVVNGNAADNGAPLSGAAYVYVRSGTTWTQQAYLKASNGEADDTFGRSVAVRKDTVLVGAPGESSSATGVDGDPDNDDAYASGAAYVFERTGGVFKQTAYLKSGISSSYSWFGTCAAVIDNGFVVGSPSVTLGVKASTGDPPMPAEPDRIGSVHVFAKYLGSWSEKGSILGDAGDTFGSAVAATPGTMVVAAPVKKGSYVYVGSDGVWNRQGGLLPGVMNGLAASGNTVAGGNEDGIHVMVRSGIAWTERGLVPFPSAGFGALGTGLTGDELFIGVYSVPSLLPDGGLSGPTVGKVHVFR